MQVAGYTHLYITITLLFFPKKAKIRLLIRLQRYEEALTACEQAILLDPSYINNYTYKAQVLHYLKRYSEAARVSKQLLQLDPTNKGSKKYLRGLKLYRVDRVYGELWRVYYVCSYHSRLWLYHSRASFQF